MLTASGGPFRQRDPGTLHDVTPDQACAHPNWVMGRKISVDSATMMNKALEVIEARWLFELRPEQVKVVIHPQSIIHSMVVCRDASVLAQLGTPDMRGPIAYGLSFPQRIESGAAALDFTSLSALTFEPADARRFPGLHLSWAALHGPEGSCTVLNAANEVAVAAFLDAAHRFHRDSRAECRHHRGGVARAARIADAGRSAGAGRARARVCPAMGARARNLITTVLAFLLTLAILVVIHEYGHYRVAVACGVKVLRFSVGFGRVLWSRRSGADGTEFVLSALPLGGYVRMLDEREAPVAPGSCTAPSTASRCRGALPSSSPARPPTCCWRYCCSPRRSGSAPKSPRRCSARRWPTAWPNKPGCARATGCAPPRATAATGPKCAR